MRFFEFILKTRLERVINGVIFFPGLYLNLEYFIKLFASVQVLLVDWGTGSDGGDSTTTVSPIATGKNNSYRLYRLNTHFKL